MENYSKTLFDLLSVSVILHQTAPYLTISSIYALAATSKTFRYLVNDNASVMFRYVDLSTVKSVNLTYEPIDTGGVNWRSQRMDEALTQAEFYSGPIRGVFSKLHRQSILIHVQTLVLDGLSVPADLIHDIVSETRFNVRVLSIREAKNLDERKLMQVLRYAVRPSRPADTPRLKALYVFQPRNSDVKERPLPVSKKYRENDTSGVTTSEGAQIGASWNEKSQQSLNLTLGDCEDRWYQSSGRMFNKPLPEWGSTLKECEGLIAFDAVLCRGPRHDVNTCPPPKDSLFLPPVIANVALGPSGCSACGSCPEGPACYGRSPSCQLPLLSPPPLHSTSIRAAQSPLFTPNTQPPLSANDLSTSYNTRVCQLGSPKKVSQLPILIVRCEPCLQGRWCERCNRWWDEDCHQVSLVGASTDSSESWNRKPESIKMGSYRDCFGCGLTCMDCKAIYNKRCRRCRSAFCILCNEGSTSEACDWCSRSGRLRRELY